MTSNINPGTLEPAHPTSSLINTKWTKPDYNLPLPSLQFLFHLECDMDSFKHIGKGPYGDRSTVTFKGGRFEGPLMRGEILPGGGGTIHAPHLPFPVPFSSRIRTSSGIPATNVAQSDWEIINNHGDMQTAHLDTRYNLHTHDGATIYLQTTGTRTGRRDVLEKLGEDTGIKPDQFRMRLSLKMECGDPRYTWVNDGVFIASSGRVGDQVIYDAYQVL